MRCSPAGRVLTASVAVPARTWRPTSPRHRATPTTARSPRTPTAGASRRRVARPLISRRPRPGPLAGEVALGQDARIDSAVVLVAPRRARVLGGCAPAPRHADQGGGGMPPEQDDLNRQLQAPQQQENLNCQLEALQRYVSGLQQQREHAKAAAAQPPPEPEPRRPSRRWLLLTGLLVTVALVGGV